ncbi:aminotransferase class V-fold PLP-dependent enzyme [Parafrigoribacterium mesophilum]|uniref:kynureninase n=1 Tax=Parafrigoribacterium mesophilum TaxID=433646 RepID=UPI0031FDCE9A
MTDSTLEAARALDATDPLRDHRDRFVSQADVVAYLDGNSLGRPLAASADRLARFATDAWGARLIRGWDEEWYQLPLSLGDTLGEVVLGAAPGQTFVGDSTTVILYKLMRAALDARPGRDEIVVDTGNFPTDRFLLQGIAEERGVTLTWITPDPDAGVTAAKVAAAVGPRTALVVLSHVDYRSGYLADAPAITRAGHDAGALVLFDLCHSVGVVPLELDAWGVDLAAGCTYKYLNGGPGAPAFGYVRAEHQDSFQQPIWGWMGSSDPFAMGPEYEPHPGIRRFISGTPPVIGMLPMRDMLALIEKVGLAAVREKSVRITEYAIGLTDAVLAPLGVVLASPRDAARRGSHVTITHEKFREVNTALWKRGIIPDFRSPNGIRLGLSPLSTSFEELWHGVDAIREELG